MLVLGKRTKAKVRLALGIGFDNLKAVAHRRGREPGLAMFYLLDRESLDELLR